MSRADKKTGIELKAEKVTVIAPRTKVHGLSFVVLFLFFQAGLYGTFYSFITSFRVEFGENILFWGILVMGLLLWLFYFTGKYMRMLIPISLICVCGWAYWHAQELKNQSLIVMNAIREAANRYFVMELDPYTTNPLLGNDTTEILLLIMILFGVTLFLGLVAVKSRMLVLMGTILPTAGAMMVGLVPSFWSLCLILFCYVGAFTMGKGEFSLRKSKVMVPKYYRNGVVGYSALFMGVAAVALFGISYLVLNPQMEKLNVQVKEARVFVQNNSLVETVRNMFPKLRISMSGAGQIDSGQLGGNVYFTGEEALKLTMYSEPGETIYLKGYTGDEYTGSRWSKDDDLSFFEDAQMGSAEDVRREYFEQPFQLASMLEEEAGEYLKQTILVEKVGASSEEEYAPYISRQESGSKDETAYSFYGRGSYEQLINANGYASLYDFSPLSGSYRDYVYGKYLSYPEERLINLAALCESHPMTDLNEIKDFIVTTLTGNAKYNLQPGECPANKDFAEYFLFERKEGYCVHFATTAVLMFRMYGIPARYAAGYIAPASEFTINADGEYEGHIKDEKAHAWAEIYVDGEGWMPVEATPGYTGAVNRNDEEQSEAAQSESQSEKKKQVQTEGKQELKTETQTETADNSGFFRDSMTGRISLMIILAVAAAALVFTVIMVRRILILKRRAAEDVRGIFASMYEVMVLGGLPKKFDGTEPGFVKEVVQRFEGIDPNEFARAMDLVMQANYGDGVISSQDTGFVRAVYVKVCKIVYQKLSGAEKLEYKYIKVF